MYQIQNQLNVRYQVLLNKFASLTGATVTGVWKANVTHIVASTDEHGACKRTRTVLLAILNGKWVLKTNWVEASIIARSPVCEEPYEISLDQAGASNGPKKGRIRATRKEPKIFTGVNFYFGNQFYPLSRRYLEELVLAAGGTVLKEAKLTALGSNGNVLSSKSSYIVYDEDIPPNTPQTANWQDLLEIGKKRCDEVEAVATKTGFMVIGHFCLLDTIAACNSANDLAKGAIQL